MASEKMSLEKKQMVERIGLILEATAQMYVNDHELPNQWWDEVHNYIHIVRTDAGVSI